MQIEADGDFTFFPKAGTSCTDTSDFFPYTVSDQAVPTPAIAVGTVTITIADCVWYVDGSAAPGGAGTSSSPFNSLAGVNGAGGLGDSDAAGQTIFLYGGSYSGGLPLEGSQTLLAQRHGLSVPDGGSGTVTLEPPAGPSSTISGGVTLAANNILQGVDLGDSAGFALVGLGGRHGDDQHGHHGCDHQYHRRRRQHRHRRPQRRVHLGVVRRRRQRHRPQQRDRHLHRIGWIDHQRGRRRRVAHRWQQRVHL